MKPAEYKKALVELEKSNPELHVVVVENDKALAAATKSNGELDKELETALASNEELNAALATANETNTTLTAELNTASETLESANATIEALNAENAALKTIAEKNPSKDLIVPGTFKSKDGKTYSFKDGYTKCYVGGQKVASVDLLKDAEKMEHLIKIQYAGLEIVD